MSRTIERIFEFLSEDGNCIEIEVQAKVAWSDEGIGAYEFWGSTGYHSDYRPEIQEMHMLKWQVFDEEGNILARTDLRELQAENVYERHARTIESAILEIADTEDDDWRDW